MKYVVSNECVGCGTCSGICPKDALGPAGPHFAIDPDRCIGCSACYRVCPFEAIVPEDGAVPEDILPADVSFPREFPLIKNGMPHNLDGSSITMEQWLGDEPEFDHVDEVIEADVAVLGAGLAGTSAVRAAAEAGAKVVLFEKMNGPRGRSGDIAVIGSELEKKWWGKDYTAYKEEIFKQFMRDLGWRPDYKAFKYWIEHNGECFDWFMEGTPDVYVMGSTTEVLPADVKNWVVPERWPLPEGWDMDKEFAKAYPVTLRLAPSLVPEMWNSLKLGMRTGNVKCCWNTPAKKLLRAESGEMTGVIAQNTKTGKVIQCNAKSVIVATGDFVGDEAMTYYYAPWAIRDTMGFSMRNPKNPYRINVGDGHKMAMRIGAVMEDGPIGLINHCMGGALGCAGMLNINANGVRFMNEELDGQSWEHILARQRECRGYQIFDSKFEEYLPKLNPGHGAACGVAPAASTAVNPQQQWMANDSYTNLEDVMAIANGKGPGKRAVMADTIEELVEKLDLEPEAKAEALKTIARYNELCEKGVDEDFGKSSERMFPIKEGPFFASNIGTAGVLCTVGGLDCDSNCNVFDGERRPIPGLYVCGNTQGNRFPVDYPMILPGISHSSCITFGRLAGTNAAEFAKA